MTLKKYAAFGTALLQNGTEIAQVQNISGPAISLDTEDVTSHDSEDAYEELVGTILRTGEISLDLLFDPTEASHTGLITTMESREVDSFELQFPDDAMTQWSFNAFVVNFEPDMPHDGALAAAVTLKITGTPTLTGSYSS
jgi:predicted secreted protein